MPFYLRILLSLWAALLVALAITFSVASLLPQGSRSNNQSAFARNTVSAIADELRAILSANPDVDLKLRLSAQDLDFSPLLVVYVVDAQGNNVLDLPMPPGIAMALSGQYAEGERADLHIEAAGLHGYLVVGREMRLPILWLIARPGGRAVLILTGLLVSAMISVMLARFIVQPVKRMRDAGHRVAAGDLTVRVAHTVGSRDDDIAKLARDFDHMTQRVQTLLANQQRLMRDVSHELRSPLARLQALLSIARQRTGDSEAMQLDRMESELSRLDELIGNVLAFARLEAMDRIRFQPIDLIDLIQNILDDASLEAQTSDRELRLQGPERCVLAIDGSAVAQAVENVVRNALRHTADGTIVDVSVERTGSGVRIIVEDRGPGVPEEALSQLFDSFFRVETGRSTRSGSGGLGLAITERSVRLHGGSVHAENRDGGGLRVVMILPG